MKTKMQSIPLNAACVLIVISFLVVGCVATVEDTPKVDIGTVMLDIDFPDDEQQADLSLQVGCAADCTVFEILQRAETESDLKIEFSANIVQESSSIFVKGFNGVVGAEGKFWTYYVNDELAKESCGTCKVKPGDKIRWGYGQPPAELE